MIFLSGSALLKVVQGALQTANAMLYMPRPCGVSRQARGETKRRYCPNPSFLCVVLPYHTRSVAQAQCKTTSALAGPQVRKALALSAPRQPSGQLKHRNIHSYSLTHAGMTLALSVTHRLCAPEHQILHHQRRGEDARARGLQPWFMRLTPKDLEDWWGAEFRWVLSGPNCANLCGCS